jgi:glycosyltransferase involved in cell wall biosynthesis
VLPEFVAPQRYFDVKSWSTQLKVVMNISEIAFEGATPAQESSNIINGGRRKDPNFMRASNSGVRVTVVTVVFNGVNCLEETIRSVVGQSYGNVEYIVIDGGSTDGTVDILRRYDHLIDYWVSERDSGIYAAMNKGIKLSTGEWINFMNAGDCFYSSNTIENVVQSLDKSFAVVAGGVCYLYDANNMRTKRADVKFSGVYMNAPHHQASFIDNSLMKLIGYDEKFRIRGDLNFMAILHAGGKKFRVIDSVICKVDTNGVSSGLSLIHISEEIRAGKLVIKHYMAKCIMFHLIYVVPRLLLRKLLPKSIESRIRAAVRN